MIAARLFTHSLHSIQQPVTWVNHYFNRLTPETKQLFYKLTKKCVIRATQEIGCYDVAKEFILFKNTKVVLTVALKYWTNNYIIADFIIIINTRDIFAYYMYYL